MTLTTTHIEELLEKCRAGERLAQMEIYNKYYKAMYNTSLRIVKHSAEAEDIMQESFLRAFTKMDTFQGNSSFGAWLKRIVVNQSISALNKNTKLQEHSLEEEIYKLHDDGLGNDLQEEGVDPMLRKVLSAMEGLKENYRIVLSLHLIEGYDYEEICEILNISYANCRTSISRAKESLRKKLM